MGLLAIAYVLLLLVDCYFTHRRVKLFGDNIELSGLVGWSIHHFGLVNGIGIGLILPNLVALGLLMHTTIGLALIVGARVHLAYWQFNSFDTEAAMLEALEEMRQSRKPSED